MQKIRQARLPALPHFQLYHLDAMEDPAHPAYPQELLDKVGPRNMVHSWASDKDDPTVMPRWGKVGKQKIEDAGTVENGIISGLDWFPTFLAAAGEDSAVKGK